MKSFIKVMKALSDPNRVKMIKMLEQKKLCVCEIQSGLEISQPNVSKHLRILEEAGLVGSQKNGLWVDYFLINSRKVSYAAKVLGHLKYWIADDPEIVELVKKVPLLDRENLTSG